MKIELIDKSILEKYHFGKLFKPEEKEVRKFLSKRASFIQKDLEKGFENIIFATK